MFQPFDTPPGIGNDDSRGERKEYLCRKNGRNILSGWQLRRCVQIIRRCLRSTQTRFGPGLVRHLLD